MFISPLANLIVNILVNNRNFNTQMAQMHGQMNRMSLIGRNFGNYFIVTAGIAALIEVVGKLEEIETGFIRIERVARDFKGTKFREDIFDLAGDISGTSIIELQKVMKIAAQLGIRGKENLMEFSEQVAILQNITGLGDELASDVGKILQVFDLAPTQAEKLINTILQISDDFNVLESEITNIVRRIGAFAKSIGLSADETIAFAGAMKDVGVNTEIAASSLYTFFARLQTNPFKLGRALGFDDKEIENMFIKLRQKPVEAIIDILEHLKKLPPSLRLGVFKELELYGVRNAAALGTLAEKVDRLKEALSSASIGLNENTKLLEGQFAVTDSLRGKIDDMSDAWNRFLFTIGNTDAIKSTFTFFSNLLNETSRQIMQLDGLWKNFGSDKIVDFSDPASIGQRIAELERRLEKGFHKEGRRFNWTALGGRTPGLGNDNPFIMWMEEFTKSRAEFVNNVTLDKPGVIKELSVLRKALERLNKFEEIKNKKIEPEKLGQKEVPSFPEIMKEFNILKAQDEKKKKKRDPAFEGFMGLTEAFKNRILDMQNDEKVKIKALNDIHKEAIEQNDHLEDMTQILRTRTFPAVLV